jgi:hypothetical protein
MEDLADAAASIGKKARSSAAGVQALADQTRRLKEAKEFVRRELGRDVGDDDAAKVLENFERRRKGNTVVARNLRHFSDFGGWAKGNPGLYRTRREYERARRYTNQALLEGTNAAGGAPPDEGGGGGGGGRAGGDMAAGVHRARSTAMGFGKSMLALAGIGSVGALALRAKDLATEEATGTDTLKRRMGDLGVDFEKLRDQARAAGAGLGVTYVESMRLGSAYSKEVGNLGATDLQGNGLAHRLRTQIGFSRSYGVDPTEGSQFFGQMARYGVGRDEQGQRKLALLIGDAVATSGFGGKVEDILHSVADYTASAARMTLTAPNSEAYANALTSLSASGRPGLDPQNAAAILGAADAATRRGGAMGNASLNFSYAALRNFSPGISPVDAMGLMEGGLFGTTRKTFGAGSPLGGYMGKGVGLNDVTNFDKMMPLMRQHYGSGGYFLNAVKNQFGLSSMSQAAALAGMSDKGQLGATSALLDSAHIDPMSVSASGLQTLGRVANAKGRGGLMGVYQDLMGRTDLSAAQKKALTAAVNGAGGDESALRHALASSVSGMSQEETDGSKTRQSISDLTDKLTQAGGPLLSVLNPIRDAVVAMASRIAPGYLNTDGGRPVGSASWVAATGGKTGNANRSAIEKSAMSFFMAGGMSKTQAAGMVGSMMAESGGDANALGDNGKARGLFQLHSDRWNELVGFAKERGLDPTKASTQLMFAQWELQHGEKAAGNLLKRAKTPEQAAAAGVRFERPAGYHVNLEDYYNADNWGGRLAMTQRLASESDSAPAAGGGGETHTVNVTVNNKPVAQVKLPAPVSAPKAAGAAPRVTPNYPTDQDYR